MKSHLKSILSLITTLPLTLANPLIGFNATEASILEQSLMPDGGLQQAILPGANLVFAGSKPYWEFCTTSFECASNCCSNEFSDDGKLKCSPSTGLRCLANRKGDWDFCVDSSECANGCCSKEYSDDGKLKCTPGGSRCVAAPKPGEGKTSWMGVNSFFLHTFPANRIDQILNSLKNANIKTIRIFISSTSPNSKGSGSLGGRDLEENVIGVYENSQLDQIDRMLPKCEAAGIKLIIAMHDRYSLGVWASDAYGKALNLGYRNGDAAQGNINGFYNNAAMEARFDRRIAYILGYKSKSYGGRTFGSLSNVILSFNIENESQGHLSTRHSTWLCKRATQAKRYVSNGVLISTGGGASFWDSLDETNFQCPAIDIVTLHSYDGVNTFEGNLRAAATLARRYKKKIIFEEFGTTSRDKSAFIQQATAIANGLGIPSMIWQTMPANKGDFEFWTDDYSSWSALTVAAGNALRIRSDLTP